MPRFFIDFPPTGESLVITGEDAQHIKKALRMRIGDELTLCDGKGQDYHCKIIELEDRSITAEVLSTILSKGEPKVSVVLYQALPKGDKLEYIVQKATELGVVRIVPILTEFCVSRPKQDAMKRKTTRLQKIAEEAAKQSGRGIIPQVGELQDFQSAIEDAVREDICLFCYEKADIPLFQALSQKTGSIALIIGSEGGFSEKEADLAVKAGAAAVSLGSRILRCETASIAALSAVLYANGEF